MSQNMSRKMNPSVAAAVARALQAAFTEYEASVGVAPVGLTHPTKSTGCAQRCGVDKSTWHRWETGESAPKLRGLVTSLRHYVTRCWPDGQRPTVRLTVEIDPDGVARWSAGVAQGGSDGSGDGVG